jgi:hypothetical protein
MKICTIKWNPNRDETIVEYTVDFVDSDWVTKADVLKDSIYMLQKFYDEIVMTQYERK